MVLRSDNEAAILTIVKAVQEARKPHQTVLETIPRHSHASLGHADGVQSDARGGDALHFGEPRGARR